MKRRIFVVVVIALVSVLGANAITTVEVEVTCPLCKHKNKFYDYASWGTYVYGWPSKFQYVFWPRTDGVSLYHCKKCNLTLFMWDFKALKPEEAQALRGPLAGLKPSGKRDVAYDQIPMTERLAIAAKMYEVLKGDESKAARFWIDHYRLLGYHAGQERKAEVAREARKKALRLTEAELKKVDAGKHKELFVISAAMRQFTGDEKGALQDLERAAKLTYTDPSDKDAAANLDGYLTALVKDYQAAIRAKNVPGDETAQH